MRTISESHRHFYGTHKGSTIDIQLDADGRWYIIVQNENGYGYDGWAPESVTTLKEAKAEAVRGARL